jgi:hypothetical protein
MRVSPMTPAEHPLPRVASEAIGTAFKWFVGISVLGILGGSAVIALLLRSSRPAPEHIPGLLLPVLWVAVALFVTTFAIAAFIFLKIFCDCGQKCGCVVQLPPVPTPPPLEVPTPGDVDVPKPDDVKKALDELRRLLDEAKDDLQNAVINGDVDAAEEARSRIADLEQQIRDLGGTI